MKSKLGRLIAGCILAGCASAHAVELAAPFGDGMVLQRERPVNVWGTADANESVTVSFAGVCVTTNADENGKWLVTLPAMPASHEPRTLTAGDASVADVLVGEVWIASGQSNMVMPLDGDANRFRDQDGLLVAQRTRRPDVRLMTAPEGVSASEQSKWGSHAVTWESVSPDNAAQRSFSAIGWRFAVGLRDALDVPVGVIFCAVNGTRIEGWIPPEGYAAAGLDPSDGTQVRDAGGYGRPMCLWNGKVCPLSPMTVRGFLWYQGEANSGPGVPGGIPQYAQLLKALYAGWRIRFGNPNLKMVVAGLASWGYGTEWLMNEAQQKFADSEPNASMAVLNDIGILGDIHGSDKARAAERMLALALKHAYGLPVKADAPVFKSAVADGSTVTVGFENAERLRLWSCHEVALSSHFELAGADGKFHDATIENFEVTTNASGQTRLTIGNIVGNAIRLSCGSVSAPKYVRYLHKKRLGNVFNEASLPLAAFTAEIAGWEKIAATSCAQLEDGGVLSLPRGEYHFGRAGSRRVWLDPSNNASGWKQVAFPIFDKRNITIDGNGSTLVFHDAVFPFAATNCQNLTIRNLTIRTASSPCAVFTVTARDDRGFEIEMAADSAPARVVDGELELDFEGARMSTRNECLSIHAVDRLRVHFLVTAQTPGDRGKYATTHMSVSVRELGNRRIRFDYVGPEHSKETILPFTPGDRCMLPYAVGERCAINLTARRKQDALFFEDCSGVTVENVKIPRFGGMGLVAQRSGDIRISGLEALPEGELGITTTADILHLVNCYGDVLIENCRASHSMDDALNIHGNYLQVERADGARVRLRVMHHEQEGFFPYRPGDEVEFAEAHSRDVVHKARVVSCRRDASDSCVCHLTIDAGAAVLKPGLLVENVTLNPNVTLRGNDFHNHPNVRLSGRGKYLIEKNRFAHSRTALVVLDLAEYWYESGRVSDMTIRDNLFDDCNALGGDTFMTFGVSGWEGKPDAPKVHGTIRLENNRYRRVRGKRWTVGGVRQFEPDES